MAAPQNFNSITREIIKLPPGFNWGELPKDITYSNNVAEFVPIRSSSSGPYLLSGT